MTIQALCTAIRSQLHFSQITAWSDVLKASSPNDPELKSNPRIKTTSKMPFKPKLDILYRIRPYSDATPSCFSAKPITHNFPETMITEHLSIKVSLKSLPRMKCLPRLYMDVIDIACNSDLVTGESPTTSPIIVDDRQEFDCREKGKHRCAFAEESPTDDAISHRDKQLMKYRKRIMRRDKKKRTDDLASHDKVMANIRTERSSRNVKDQQKLSMTHFRCDAKTFFFDFRFTVRSASYQLHIYFHFFFVSSTTQLAGSTNNKSEQTTIVFKHERRRVRTNTAQ